jgi:hypothetical protein
MAKTTIGDLSVRISASATEFEKVLAGAQTSFTKFASKVTSPVGYASKISSIATGAFMGPGGVIAGAAGQVASLIDPINARLFNTEKTNKGMDEALEKITELAHEAKKLDFEPRFLGALKLAAGRDADSVVAAVQKMQRTIGESAAGGSVEMKNGQTNKDKLAKYGLDLDELAGMSSQDALVMVGKRLVELKDHNTEAALSFDALGKGGKNAAEGIKKFAEDTEKYINKLKSLGLYSDKQVHMAEAEAGQKREFKLRETAFNAREWEAWGAARDEGERKMAESGIFSSKHLEGVNQVNAALDVRNMRALGGNITMDEYAPKNQAAAVIEGRIAAAKEAAGPNAAEQKIQNAKDAAMVATKTLIDKLDKETAAIYGVSAADEVAAVSKRKYVTEAQKAEIQASLRRHELAKPDKAADEMLLKLTETNDAWGKSVDFAKAYKMALDGVNPSKVAKITEQLERQERLKLEDETRTPLEQMEKRVSELQKLHDTGVIGDDLFGRGLGKAAKSIMGNAADYRNAPLALKGTAEAYKLETADRLQWQNAGRDPMDRLIEAAAMLKAAAGKDREFEKNLIDTLNENGIGILTGGGA